MSNQDNNLPHNKIYSRNKELENILNWDYSAMAIDQEQLFHMENDNNQNQNIHTMINDILYDCYGDENPDLSVNDDTNDDGIKDTKDTKDTKDAKDAKDTKDKDTKNNLSCNKTKLNYVVKGKELPEERDELENETWKPNNDYWKSDEKKTEKEIKQFFEKHQNKPVPVTEFNYLDRDEINNRECEDNIKRLLEINAQTELKLSESLAFNQLLLSCLLSQIHNTAKLQNLMSHGNLESARKLLFSLPGDKSNLASKIRSQEEKLVQTRQNLDKTTKKALLFGTLKKVIGELSTELNYCRQEFSSNSVPIDFKVNPDLDIDAINNQMVKYEINRNLSKYRLATTNNKTNQKKGSKKSTSIGLLQAPNLMELLSGFKEQKQIFDIITNRNVHFSNLPSQGKIPLGIRRNPVNQVQQLQIVKSILDQDVNDAFTEIIQLKKIKSDNGDLEKYKTQLKVTLGAELGSRALILGQTEILNRYSNVPFKLSIYLEILNIMSNSIKMEKELSKKMNYFQKKKLCNQLATSNKQFLENIYKNEEKVIQFRDQNFNSPIFYQQLEDAFMDGMNYTLNSVNLRYSYLDNDSIVKLVNNMSQSPYKLNVVKQLKSYRFIPSTFFTGIHALQNLDSSSSHLFLSKKMEGVPVTNVIKNENYISKIKYRFENYEKEQIGHAKSVLAILNQYSHQIEIQDFQNAFHRVLPFILSSHPKQYVQIMYFIQDVINNYHDNSHYKLVMLETHGPSPIKTKF